MNWLENAGYLQITVPWFEKQVGNDERIVSPTVPNIDLSINRILGTEG